MKRRAYLLLEVAVGGAMVAVLIGTILTSMSQARTLSVTTNRDLIANALVMQELDRQRALGFAGAVAATPAAVTGINGRYLRGVTVTSCVESIPAPGANINCKDVTVTVTFQTSNNARLGTSTTRSSTASVRVYE